jgi:hypothetical protein
MAKRFISCLNTTALVPSISFTLFFIVTFTFASTSIFTFTSVFLLLTDALRSAFLFHFIICAFLTDS